jgi:GNAT superfamily N-acetyltransferase
MTTRTTTSWTFTAEPFDSPDAVALWAAYYTEVSDRWFEHHHGRPTEPAALARGIASVTGEDLTPPGGLLIVARYDGRAAGCGGIRMVQPGLGELRRVYVRPERRATGGAALLLAALEDGARGLGAERVRLTTRHDLVEARGLYAKCGYAEVPAFVEEAFAERFFEKGLG